MKIFNQLDGLNVLVLILSAKVIASNGNHKKVEKKYVLDFYQKYYKTIPRADIEYILNQYLIIALRNRENHGLSKFNPFELPFICASVYSIAKEKAIRATIMYYLFEIACADKVLSSNENKLLREISYRIGFRKKATDAFFAFFKGETDIFDYTGNLHQKRKQRKAKMSYSYSGTLTVAYQVLGLNKNATIAQIKAAYRKLVRENHPDRFASLGEMHVKKATERIIKINKAYERIQSVKRFS